MIAQSRQQRFLRVLMSVLLAAVVWEYGVPAHATQPDTEPPLKHFQPNLNDKAALRNGAVEFMHQCSGCHSLQGVRYSELTKPLGLTRQQIAAHIDPSKQPIDKIILASLPGEMSKALLGVEPPDLTVEAKRILDTYMAGFSVGSDGIPW